MATFPHKLPAMTRRAITVVALALAVSAGAPAAVLAASRPTSAQAISDCYNHDQLTRSYPSEVLRAALSRMSSDVREYSDCYDVIERQLFKQLGKPTSAVSTTSAPAPSSSGSSFLPTWLIVVIVLLALAAITFGALAIRRRSTEGGGPGDGGPGGGGPGAAGPGPGAPPPPPPGPPDRGPDAPG